MAINSKQFFEAFLESLISHHANDNLPNVTGWAINHRRRYPAHALTGRYSPVSKRIGNSIAARSKFLNLFRATLIPGVHGEDLYSPSPVFLVDPVKLRDLYPARRTPGCPEIHQGYPVFGVNGF